jgi:hypothetical protein
MHSIHQSTALHPSMLSIYPTCAPSHPMHSIHHFMEFGGFFKKEREENVV